MLPFMAQGAAMAVEDAWVVAREMTQKTSPARGLEAYQHLRQTRANRVQAGSRANAKNFHKRTRLGQLVTYGPMWLAGKFAPVAVHKLQDPIYGHDVTRLDK